MKKLLFFTVPLLTLCLFISSCKKDDDEVMPPSTDIVQLARDNGLTAFASAIEKAELADDLQAMGPFTIFAPTNEAFTNLLQAVGQSSIDDLPPPVLEKILLYHVINAEVLSTEVSPGAVTTLEGSDINLDNTEGITVNNVKVITPFDLEASNGVIHTLEEVLVPSSIAQFVNTVLEPAYFNKDFTSLITAASKADLVETLLNTPDLTIFAPSNAAFTEAGIDPSSTDKETLVAVLTYHVLGSKVLSKDLTREAKTLNGNNLYFSLVSAGNFINGNTEIVAVDIESGTGVVHVIDKVLLPPVGNIVETAVGLAENGEFNILVDALKRTADEGAEDQNLISVLSGDGPFTVFAPTNAAFQALLDSNEDWNSLYDIPLNFLITVLTYHVVPARAYDKDLAGALDENQQLPTAQGQKITIDLNTLTINADTKIIGVNTNATNGVIHVIDKVLLPQ
ncbi:fasciclin domain-containing protein [Xanthovirga aplysinae]|uniref:fasciclin domain-containing protein n=1 Tax=Xanthovirga aplysinae TaxID=2529853 RepID=UPI0012BC79CF|nr:fasciclin domain-containing protein [Xanthovirga aplysinae]MTI30745.1 fasciclin domain-containing protein [Xanthovirga aplysinae]